MKKGKTERKINVSSGGSTHTEGRQRSNGITLVTIGLYGNRRFRCINAFHAIRLAMLSRRLLLFLTAEKPG